MKNYLFINICFLLFIIIACTKNEKDIIKPNGEISPIENIELYLEDPIKIEFNYNETIGITDINDLLKKHLNDKPDEYLKRINTIVFRQEYSKEGNLEHLGMIELLPNIQHLTISSNLTSVDTSALPRKLLTIDLSNNNLLTFNAVELPKILTSINLSHNKLTLINGDWRSDYGGVTDINLSFNNLSSFDTSKLRQDFFNSLDLSNNPIEGVFDISKINTIRSLNISNTLINKIYLNYVEQYLDCTNTFIENIEEFLNLEYCVFQLTFPVPKHYSTEEAEDFMKKMIENFPAMEHNSFIHKNYLLSGNPHFLFLVSM